MAKKIQIVKTKPDSVTYEDLYKLKRLQGFKENASQGLQALTGPDKGLDNCSQDSAEELGVSSLTWKMYEKAREAISELEDKLIEDYEKLHKKLFGADSYSMEDEAWENLKP